MKIAQRIHGTENHSDDQDIARLSFAVIEPWFHPLLIERRPHIRQCRWRNAKDFQCLCPTLGVFTSCPEPPSTVKAVRSRSVCRHARASTCDSGGVPGDWARRLRLWEDQSREALSISETAMQRSRAGSRFSHLPGLRRSDVSSAAGGAAADAPVASLFRSLRRTPKGSGLQAAACLEVKRSRVGEVCGPTIRQLQLERLFEGGLLPLREAI